MFTSEARSDKSEHQLNNNNNNINTKKASNTNLSQPNPYNGFENYISNEIHYKHINFSSTRDWMNECMEEYQMPFAARRRCRSHHRWIELMEK